jgi:hypothetical protein
MKEIVIGLLVDPGASRPAIQLARTHHAPSLSTWLASPKARGRVRPRWEWSDRPEPFVGPWAHVFAAINNVNKRGMGYFDAGTELDVFETVDGFITFPRGGLHFLFEVGDDRRWGRFRRVSWHNPKDGTFVNGWMNVADLEPT